MKENIFLYGPPGVGKSTIGSQLAENLALPFFDLDSEIEAKTRAPIPAIFAAEGESGFRQREKQLLEEVLPGSRGVIALGGGALIDPANRARVEAAGTVVCLDAPQEVLAARLGESATTRPLLSHPGSSGISSLLADRAGHYASFPIRLDTSQLESRGVVREIQVRLGWFFVRGMDGRTRREKDQTVTQPAGYEVRVQPGGLDTLGDHAMMNCFRSPLALVSDENVGRLHAPVALANLRRSGYDLRFVTIPAREVNKNMQAVSTLWQAFLDAGLERGSAVLALGGGVVNDVAGFAAATYLRGVPLILLPSTLLAMVDASLGGKTGVDLPQGKNLIGAFYPPRLVLADPELLATLPEEELRNGMAEVVKHGVIGDPELFALCARGWKDVAQDWGDLIGRAMAVKIDVIQKDPYEAGPRERLNLGHTIGHALELVSGYQLRHGEAVAIGLVAEAHIAEGLDVAHKGLADEVAAVLAGLGLPTEIPTEFSRSAISRAAKVDKKRAGGEIRFALPVRVGEVIHGIPVEDISRWLAS